jgi:NosR/NirI family transcriptional regulator, nitrous oxide reductase regulator
VRRNILKNSHISRRARPALLWLLALMSVLASEAVYAGTIGDRQFDTVLLQRAFPGAKNFGEIEGSPPAVTASSGGEVIGYVFSSKQVVQSTGYAAKPLDVVVGMTMDGIITGAVVAEHHEPLLVIGIHDDALADFVAQYVGMDIRRPFRVAPEGRTEDGDVDAVSGATLSSMVINNAILKSARGVASSRGLLGSLGTKLDFDSYEPVSWQGLVDEASVRALRISVADATAAVQAKGGELFARGVPQPDGDETYADLYTGLATPARIGRNLLGEKRHNQASAELDAGDQLIFVAAKGLYSFKGHKYRRRGQFDRLQLVQGANTFRFALKDHQRIEGLTPDGAPEMREIGLFAVSGDKGFDPSKPWRLQFLVSAASDENADAFALFEIPYELPARYLKATLEPPEWDDKPLWIDNWIRRQGEIAVLVAALVILSGILIFQDAVAKRHRLYQAVRTVFLVFTVVWIGWIAEAQLSVINVLTFGDALMHNFQWDFFLLEPLIFILWGYVALALVFWGRGVFCGWLCPFGALQELITRIATAARVPQLRLPFALSERLWTIKYIVFFGLFAIFLYDPLLAFRGAEIEPFKTAIILKFDRDWPFVVLAIGLLVAGVFVSRVYCRYLCPLGGALALPARMRMFEWLKRRWQCGSPCQICASNCPVQAIHPEGRINPNECIYCLNCQLTYYDDGLCPPLVDRLRRQERARQSSKEPKPNLRKPQPQVPRAD